MVLQNVFFTTMLFHTALLLIKKVMYTYSLYSKIIEAIGMLVEFTGLPMFLTILKQLA